MNFSRKAIALAMALSTSLVQAQAPSKAQMVNWMSNPQEVVAEKVKADAMTVLQTEKIQLQSGETAYLSAVEYDNTGRNFSHAYILTRPALKKSLHLTDFAGQSAHIKVLSRTKTATLLQLSGSGSGQGTYAASESVVSFDGWKTKNHYESKSYDDFATLSSGGCTAIESKLSFHDGAKPYITDEIKTVNQKDCENPKTAKRKTETKRQNIIW